MYVIWPVEGERHQRAIRARDKFPPEKGRSGLG